MSVSLSVSIRHKSPYMHVARHARVYVCVFACIYGDTSVSLYMCTYVCLYACRCICTDVGMSASIHTCCMHVDMHVCMQTCMYTSISVHMYACMYSCVQTCVPNFKFSVTVHIFCMSLNKNGYHIPNMSFSAIMLNGYIDPTCLYMCIKIQPTAISTSHGIAIYITATNMPLKCHIYAT